MVQQAAIFRVFVSSTFNDLVAERDALQRDVFPALQQLCEEHGCRFQPIDLRWGASAEAGLDQATLRICREEIARCQAVTPRPNFIILLGDRYGWQPLPDELPASEVAGVLDRLDSDADRQLLEEWYRRDLNADPPIRYLAPRRLALEPETSAEDETGIRAVEQAAWERTESELRRILHRAEGALVREGRTLSRPLRSATEEEIIAGALTVPDAKEHVLCFFRRWENPAAAPPAFIERDPDARRRLEQLKDSLRQHLGRDRIVEHEAKWTRSGVSRRYLAALCEDVRARLTAMVARQIAAAEAVDALEQEESQHRRFASAVCEASDFVGRLPLLERVQRAFTVPPCHPLVIHGPSGAGKSAAIAQAERLASALRPSRCVVLRHVGATARSADLTQLLGDIVAVAGRFYDDPRPVPSDPLALLDEWTTWLQHATVDRPLVVLIDNVDALVPVEGGDATSWLPSTLPPFVTMIVSSGEEGARCLAERLPAEGLVALEPLTPADAAAMLDRRLARAGRRLQDAQRQVLLDRFQASGSPLYVRIACEQAVRWRSDQVVTNLGQGVDALLEGFLDQLEHPGNHGPLLVRRALGYLAASRHGLAEEELLETLSRDTLVMGAVRQRSAKPWGNVSRLPVVVWSRLHHDLQPYLMDRQAVGVGLLSLRNEALRRVVAHRYLGRSEEIHILHGGLAAVFDRRCDPAGDRSWSGESRRGFSELAYHLEQRARHAADGQRTDATGLFDLALSASFRESQFRALESVDPVVECMRYALELAIDLGDLSMVMRQAIARARLVGSLNRTLLYQLADLVAARPVLASRVIDLIPAAPDRALALAFAAWLTAQDPAGRPRALAILRELGGMTTTTVHLHAVPALARMAVDLLDRGFAVEGALAGLIPGSPQRDCLIEQWQALADGRGTLARELARQPPRAAADDAEILRVGRATRKTRAIGASGAFNERGLFTHGLETIERETTEELGSRGSAMYYVLAAARSLAIGRTFDARLMLNRALYLSQHLARDQYVFTQLAMASALRRVGRPLMAEEYRDRLMTYLGQMFQMTRDAASLTVEVPLLRELLPWFKQWNAASDRQLGKAVRGLAAVGARSPDVLRSTEAVVVRAGLALMLERADDGRAALEELAARDDAALGPAGAIAQYAIARAVDDPERAAEARHRLGDQLDPEALLEEPPADAVPARPAPSLGRLLPVLFGGTAGHLLAVAASLRRRARFDRLLDLLRFACLRNPDPRRIDAIVSQLVLRPDLGEAEVSALSVNLDQLDASLGVHRGMGVYYFSSPWVRTTLVGVLLCSAGVAASGFWRQAAVLILAGALGALVDLYLWRQLEVWARPEYANLAAAEYGSLIVILGGLFLESDHLLAAVRVEGVGFGLCVAAVALGVAGAWNVVMPFRLGFGLTTKERQFAIVALLLAAMAMALFPARLTARFGSDLRAGLLLGGALVLGIGFNFAIKHWRVKAFYDAKGIHADLAPAADQLGPLEVRREWPSDSPLRAKILAADRAMVKARFAEAHSRYTAIAKDPELAGWPARDRASVYINRGMCSRRLGDFAGALDDQREAARLNPNNADPSHNAALILAQDLHRHGEAVRDYTTAIAYDPLDGDLWSDRGLCRSELGDVEQAHGDLLVALRLDPSNPNYLTNLGTLQTQRRDLSSAVETFRQAFEEAPEDYEIRFNYAAGLANRGQMNEARRIASGDRRAWARFVERSRQSR